MFNGEIFPPPYEITYKDDDVILPQATAQEEIPQMAIAEPFHLIEMDIVEEIQEAVEILIPSKYCSYDFLENKRLGLSQSQPPIIWKKRITHDSGV